MLDRLLFKIKIDWWEVTHLGLVGYFHFFVDWCKFLLGYSKFRPNRFAYSEIDLDLNISDLVENEKCQKDRRKQV